MSIRQKSRRQEDVRQSPVAEAIAIGTAAGGLVLGTMQALGGEDTDTGTKPSANALAAGDIVQPVVTEGSQAAAANASDAVQHHDTAMVTTTEIAEAVSPATAPTMIVDQPMVANSAALPVETQLVAELSQQISATLSRVMEAADSAADPVTLGQAMAADIVQSAQQIVANLDIGSLLGQTHGLGEGIVAEALGATSGIADTVLAQVIDLPPSLLGNDGSDMPGGLLSEVFYSDGGSEALAIPDLSQAAGTLVSDVAGSTSGGLLGLSYIEMGDHQGSHGLNALSLL